MMGVKKIIRPVSKEFRKSNCCFDHTPADDFVKSQWQNRTKSLLYLVYRWAIAIFFIGTVLNSMLDHEMTGHYFIYLTNWGILMCLSTSILGAVLVTLWHYHPEYADKVTDSESMPRPFKIYWAMQNIALVLSLNITIIYWSVLYNSEVELTPTNVLTHAFNSIFMFLDLLIVAYPIRILHFFLPVGFGAIFGVFTGIYYLCGGLDPKGNHYIYTILDWSKPGKTFGTIIATLLFSTLIHCLVFAVCKLRTHICKRWEKSSSMFLPTTSSSKLSKSSTPPIVTHPASGISMVLGNYEHDNQAFNGSTEKVYI